MNGIWPAEIAAFRDNHLRGSEHIAILRIAEIESFVLNNWGIEPDADNVPDEVRAFAFLSFVRPDATADQVARIDAAIESHLAALRGRAN